MKKDKERRDLSIPITRVLLVLGFVAVWQVASAFKLVDPFFISSPGAIAVDFAEMVSSGLVFRHAFITLLEMALGFVIGSFLGVAAGFILGRSDRWAQIMDPIIMALYGIPRIALVPLFILWFGLGIPSKVVFSLFLVFFLVFFNTFAGLKSVDIDVVDAVKVMGASDLQILTKVTLPFVAPWVFAGLKSGLGMSLLGAILGEYMGGNGGLGWMINYAAGLFQTTRVFSSLLVLTILVVLLNGGLKLVENRVLKWRPGKSRL